MRVPCHCPPPNRFPKNNSHRAGVAIGFQASPAKADISLVPRRYANLARALSARDFSASATFLKIPLVGKTSFATFRVPLPGGAAKKRRRYDAVAEEFLKKIKIPVDRSKLIAKVHLPLERRACPKGHEFFQLLGLQIALNLVPTMNEHREMQNLKSALRLSFLSPGSL
jgi:hypothetical protein